MPRNYVRSDERIRDEICERLTWDAWVDASEVEVIVKDGEVLLSGTIDDRAQSWRAEDLAADIAGVEDVVNELWIKNRARG